MANYVIVGGGVAGYTAAQVLRAQDNASKITLLTNEVHPVGFYARKDLVRRFAQGAYSETDITLASERDLQAQNIEILYDPALKLFVQRREVLINHSIRLPYDKLLVATGATPRIAEAPGVQYLGVHQVRQYEDVSLLEAWVPQMQAHGAVIIGGGILAVDLAYALRQRGIAVTLALREDTVGAPLFAPEVGYFTARRMLADGIQMIPQVTVAEYLSDDLFALSGVRLSNGETLPCAVAISAIGVHPNTELAAEAGIALDEISAAIVVNEHMATNSPAVYAAGNCAQYQQHSARHWEDAREQGRVAALNMLGQPTVYAPTISGNLATLFYDVPCAYFGQTSGAEQWTQHTAHDFVQVTLEQGRLVGATLLGNIAGAIHDLVAKQHQPLTSAELEAWWQTRSVVETA